MNKLEKTKTMSGKNLDYYKNLDYKIIIEQDNYEDEKWFIAYSNELGKNACYGKGETEIEAVKSFLEEKDIFIEYLYNNDKKIPEPKKYSEKEFSGVFNVRTSKIIHEKLVNQASEQGISLNLYLNQILASATENKEFENKLSDKITELKNKIDLHHNLMSKQMKFHNNALSKLKWNAEFSDGSYLQVV